MTIEQADKVDGIGIDKQTGEVVLLISDHLSWENERAHIVSLEKKLVGYINYIESGQYLESVPQAKNGSVQIKLIHEHKPTESARMMLDMVQSQLWTMNILFSYECLPAGY